MFVALDGQVGLLAHLLGKELVDHGVGATAVVGEVDGEKARVAADELGARDDVLPKGPADARVVRRDVDVMAAMELRKADDLLSVVEKDVGDAHVEGAVGNAVVARDEDEHALVGRKAPQQLVSQALHLLAELRDGKSARHHGHGGLLGRMAEPLAQAQHRARHGLLAKVHVEHGAKQLDATLLKPEVVGDQARRRLHVDAGVVVRNVGGGMPDGVDARHEDVVDLLGRQPRHVAIDELHGVAGLATGVLLGKRHDLLRGVGAQDHVVAELGEELVCQREEAMEHEAARDAHGLLGRVALAGVVLEEEFLGARVEGAVERHLLLVHLARGALGAGEVEALEGRAPKARLLRLLGCHERRSHGARDGKVRAHGKGVSPEGAEGLHDGGVIRHASLEHDMAPYALGAHDAVQVVAHDGERKPRRDVGLGGAGGEGGVDGRLDEDGAALAEVDGRCG